MKVASAFRSAIGFITFLALNSTVQADNFIVDSKQSYLDALASAVPGDDIILKNGTYQDFEIKFQAQGSEEAPITLRAESKGGVILSGQSNLSIAGSHLVVSGLVFKDGYSPSGSVISYRTSKDELANYTRVTEVVIEDYSKPDKFENDYWVALYGKHNRLDHSYLAGKRNRGVTVAVRLNTADSIENYHQIDNNYFGYRPELGSNGGETLRIGTSHYSLENSFTRVENNVFDRCNGEVEIISVKSGGNVLDGNTFIESRGTLTLRHGNGNTITNNVFLGNGVQNTGGVRIINANQEVANNVFKELTGYRFGSGFTVMNGVPNSPQNRYHQVRNANIHHNTFIDVSHIQLAAGADEERSAPPVDSIFSNNLVVANDVPTSFSFFDDISGIKFTNNAANYSVESQIEKGFTKRSDLINTSSNSISINGMQVGADSSVKALNKEDVGPNWYKKKVYVTPFSSGNEVSVEPGVNTLFEAVAKAQDGDVLVLNDGVYSEEKIIEINKTLSFKGSAVGKVTIQPQRSALFEISDNGSLQIEEVTLAGTDAPDAAGNTFIRTKKWGMLTNYRFVMTNVKVTDLDINHSYHFFSAGARSFAALLSITNSQFDTISGHVLALNKEKDDLGIYNVEVLNLENNTFNDVSGALALVYRGGTDESTFGPKVTIEKNVLTNVGLGKRNKRKASIFLHGVQKTQIRNNVFNASTPVKIEHTVGEPQTSYSGNKFNDTSDINIIDYLKVKDECRCPE
ncbi:polysaccharide lyase 6 family protein [Alteromonas sp. ALT199]|uniref:polysaccharide lyase 6 family protein n=1 Tax=unclassified Alteromonas TaxID=2614992 RepID=UPI001BE9AE29|nr:polysaccharide lyase 6 family protein [Alteromonas sp. ALT199]MBT3137191.1 polysaccharide lyase 6 family protein [Alteromonas sp. ALT199]